MITAVSEPRARETVNIGKSTFVSPDRDYQEVAGPTLRRTDLITADGKPRVVKAMELSGVPGLLFRRNSLSGAVEAITRTGAGVTLNHTLHA